MSLFVVRFLQCPDHALFSITALQPSPPPGRAKLKSQFNRSKSDTVTTTTTPVVHHRDTKLVTRLDNIVTMSLSLFPFPFPFFFVCFAKQENTNK